MADALELDLHKRQDMAATAGEAIRTNSSGQSQLFPRIHLLRDGT